MDFEMMTREDFDGLPDDSDEQFVAIERICRAKMVRYISEQTTDEFDSMIRLQYMTHVSAAALELKIPDVIYPIGSDYPASEVNNFMLSASGAATRIQLRNRRKNRGTSVKLAPRTRGLVELQIRKLEDSVRSAEMHETKRKRILAKLEELRAEVNSSRLSFSKTMAILLHVSMGVAAGTSFLADAPGAILTIQNLIGHDKAEEVREDIRLQAVPPKLEDNRDNKELGIPYVQSAPSTKLVSPTLAYKTAGFRGGFTDDLDEDVAF